MTMRSALSSACRRTTGGGRSGNGHVACRWTSGSCRVGGSARRVRGRRGAGAAAPTAQVGKLVPDTGPSGLYSVAVSGGTIVVGANGAAYVFERNATGSGRSRRASRRSRRRRAVTSATRSRCPGTPSSSVSERWVRCVRLRPEWQRLVQQAKLTPTDGPMAGDFTAYGASLAISGNTADRRCQRGRTRPRERKAGAGVPVFERDAAGVWSQRAKLEACRCDAERPVRVRPRPERLRGSRSARPTRSKRPMAPSYVLRRCREHLGTKREDRRRTTPTRSSTSARPWASRGSDSPRPGVPVSQRFPSHPDVASARRNGHGHVSRSPAGRGRARRSSRPKTGSRRSLGSPPRSTATPRSSPRAPMTTMARTPARHTSSPATRAAAGRRRRAQAARRRRRPGVRLAARTRPLA